LIQFEAEGEAFVAQVAGGGVFGEWLAEFDGEALGEGEGGHAKPKAWGAEFLVSQGEGGEDGEGQEAGEKDQQRYEGKVIEETTHGGES
jgi:hypothetical protein